MSQCNLWYSLFSVLLNINSSSPTKTRFTVDICMVNNTLPFLLKLDWLSKGADRYRLWNRGRN